MELQQHCSALVCEHAQGPLSTRAVLTSHRLPFLVNPRQTGVKVDIGRLPVRKHGDVARTHVTPPSAIICASSTHARNVLLRPQAHQNVKSRCAEQRDARWMLAWRRYL